MPSLKYVVGTRFGRLVIEERKGFNVVCKCDCGTIRKVNYTSLVAGHTTSCGCLLKESRSNNGKRNAVDLSGQKFGMLSAVEPVGRKGSSHEISWLFLCDCGNHKVIRGSLVKRGQIVSCGCARGLNVPIRTKEHRDKKANYIRVRRSKDLRFALTIRIGNAIRKSLRKSKSKKRAHWEDVLGYTAKDLIERLITTMPKGYSWEDYRGGKLHIDHKRPLASFSFCSIEDTQFLDAWALSNLQLLTAEDNMRKRANVQ